MSALSPRTRSVLSATLSVLALSVPSALAGQEAPVDSSFAAAAPVTALPSPASQAAFSPPVGPSILGGTLGSGVGMIGGAFAGYAMATCGPNEWFCGFGEAALGALVGGVVGSTVGANIGARRGGATPTFKSTVVGGLVGVLTGLAGGYVGAQIDPDGPGALIGFSLGQGVVTGLVAARRH